MSNLNKLYYRVYMSKSSITCLIICFLIFICYSFYYVYSNYNNYYIYTKLINDNYFCDSYNLLKIILTFITVFLFIKESNLSSDSLNSFFETSVGRKKIFICKQSIMLEIIFIISSIYYISVYGSVYLIFELFKMNFIIDFLYLYLFLIGVLEISLLINYIFKNYFISIILIMLVIVIPYFNIPYFEYFIPYLKFENETVNNNIFYMIVYNALLVFINLYIYRNIDRI